MFDPKRPFVSVIVPVYNGEAFLADALTSILDQNYRPIEVIIIDDGSTDSTAQIAQQFGDRVQYVYRANGGPAAARNTGLRLARGELIAFLDADDIWTGDSLSQQLACLNANPTAGLALGCLQILVQTSSATGAPTFQPWSTPHRLLMLQCALVRRKVFDQLGTFDETYFSAEDIDWFMRAREAGIVIVTHPAITVLARRHPHNLTNQQTRVRSELALALKKSLERRSISRTDPTLPALTYWSDSTPSLSTLHPDKASL
ncbi:MAG: glycosyltransferase family A protein [Chloroflexi bacterium]|nr:glycosyltransferase family A protein [Chloroflexota bacterium]